MHGIDVSNNNATNTVDWNGVAFVGIKASESVNFTDQLFDTYVQVAIAKGIPWFPYHFAHPDVNSAAAEAAFFLSKWHGRLNPPWPPALDFETRGSINPLAKMGAAAAGAWIDEFLNEVWDATATNGLFYTFRDYAKVLYPVVEDRWLRWLASAKGQPTYPTYNGFPIAIEQWGQVGGIDVNESYIPIGDTVTPEEHAMIVNLQTSIDAVYASNARIEQALANLHTGGTVTPTHFTGTVDLHSAP